MSKKFVVVIAVIFGITAASIYLLGCYQPAYQVVALHIANVVMAALSLSAYIIVNKQVDNRPQAFVRGVYGASFLRLMVCMTAVLAYVLINRKHIHKPTVFVLFGVYAVYSAAETVLLQRSVKK